MTPFLIFGSTPETKPGSERGPRWLLRATRLNCATRAHFSAFSPRSLSDRWNTHLWARSGQSPSPRPLRLCITMQQRHNFIKVSLCLGASLTGALSRLPVCRRWLKVQTFPSLSASPRLLNSSLLLPLLSGQAECLLSNMLAPWDTPISLL